MEWLAILAAVVIGVPAAAWLAQDHLIFFPQPIVSTAHLPPGTTPLEVVAADGTRLRGWLRSASRSPAPLVLYFGGNAEEVSWMVADRRWPHDWAVAALNYRGYGASEGKPGEKALVADAFAIYDAVATHPGIDREPVVAFGRSLGAGIAVKLAAQRPLAGVVLVSPYDSLVAIGRMHYPFLPVSWLLKHRFDVIDDAPRIRVPMLAIVAEGDRVIPPARSRALFDAWAGPKRWEVVSDANHDTVGESTAFWQRIVRFLADVESG